MALFIGILLFFWLVALGAYFFFTRWFRSSDADKIKSRLMGTPKKTGKARGFEGRALRRGRAAEGTSHPAADEEVQPERQAVRRCSSRQD